MKGTKLNIYNNHDEFFNKVCLNNGSVARAAVNTPCPVTDPQQAPKRYLKKTRDAWDRFMYYEVDSGLLSYADLVLVELMFDSLDRYYRYYKYDDCKKLAESEFAMFDKSAISFFVSKKERDRLKALAADPN